jgi:hypothetical protein
MNRLRTALLAMTVFAAYSAIPSVASATKISAPAASAASATTISAPAAPVASATTISVPAAGTYPNYYTDSGVYIPAGGSVVVSASGMWSDCTTYLTAPCVTGPDGFGGFPPAANYTDPSANSGTLLGSVDGGNTWSAIGAGPTVVQGPGELLLATNDINPAFSNCNVAGPTGCYGDNTGAVSAVITFSTFATFATPTSKASCKKGGWQSLTDANGTPFKNQGDCVSYVATGGFNLAAG